jgi:hypothetical protein
MSAHPAIPLSVPCSLTNIAKGKRRKRFNDALSTLLAASFSRYQLHNKFVPDRLVTSLITNVVVPLMVLHRG